MSKVPADLPTDRHRQERYQQLIESLGGSYFETDLTGKLTEFNDFICAFHGRTREELASLSFGDFIPSDQVQGIFDAFQQVYRTGHPSPVLTYDVIRKDGSVLSAESAISLRRDADGRPVGFCGVTMDITKKKRTAKALQESEESHRAILETAPYAITIIRASDWTYVHANNAFCQITGFSIEEVVGRTSGDLGIYKDKADRDRLIRAFQRNGEVDRFEVAFRIKDGRLLDYLLSARSIRFKGEACLLTISSDISEIKATQRALQQSEQSYRTILQTAPYTIVITRLSDTKYVEVNEAYSNRTGYSREETLGRTPYDLNLYERPADRDRLIEILRRSGHVQGMEIRFRNKKGRILESLVSSSPIRYKGEECMLTMTVDINTLKETQRALEESEARFRTIFETAADPIFLNDAQSGRFISVNRAACRHLGYERDDFPKLSLKDVNDPDALDPLTNASGHQSEDAPLFFEATHVRKDGSKAIVEVSSQPMVHQGRRVLLSIVRDVTLRKETEAELARYQKNLEQMVAERTSALEAAQHELVKGEKLAVLGQLTATVSHELRNPLGVIRSSNFYLQRKIKDRNEKTDKHFNRIEDQISICDAIVADLLEYTRGRNASMVTEDPTPWIRQVVEQVREQEEIGIEIQLNERLQPVPHDQEKMRRVIINVLLNAIQAVRARVESDRGEENDYTPIITLSAMRQETDMVFEVTDNGIGMDEETCRRAFEPLFTTRARGTGIGLANVKKIMGEHAGTISLESRPGEGTRIRLSLPYSSEG